MARLSRRQFLRGSSQSLAYLSLARATAGFAAAASEPASRRLRRFGLLQAISELGLRVPLGYQARIVAQAGVTVPGTDLRWHTDPDGGACFAAADGGFVYVSNREHTPGGVNALRFNAHGTVVDAYPVLNGIRTRRNCGGGPTPWNTWLSAEEYDAGVVWECDPFGRESAQRREALGTFNHEACAVDPATNRVYLTEDKPDGRLYRFVPNTANVGARADLGAGSLQVMRVAVPQSELDKPGLLPPTAIDWLDLPNPNPRLGGFLAKPTRAQVPESSAFNGGEGIWHHAGRVYFTTKGDCRVWVLDLAAQTLAGVYDDALHERPVLDAVDNLLVTPGGDLVVAEDKDEASQQLVVIGTEGKIFALVELLGQAGSEIAGPAFSPDGRHLLFSSQRGPGANAAAGSAGVTYCVSGPWFEA